MSGRLSRSLNYRSQLVELAIWLSLLSISIITIFYGINVINSWRLVHTTEIMTYVRDSNNANAGNLTLRLSVDGGITALNPVNVSVDLDWFYPLSDNSTYSVRFQGAYAQVDSTINDTVSSIIGIIPLSQNSTMPGNHLQSVVPATLIWTRSGNSSITIEEVSVDLELNVYSASSTIEVESWDVGNQVEARHRSEGAQWLTIGSGLLISTSFLYGVSTALKRRPDEGPFIIAESSSRTLRRKGEMKGIIERILYLPPSFYALLSGSLLGTAIGFSAELLRTKGQFSDLVMGALAVIFSLCSVVSFTYVSIALEILRDDLRETPEKEYHLHALIRSKRKRLVFSLVLGAVCVVFSLSCRYFALG